MRYEIVNQGTTMKETNSFHDAISYAHENEWDVYDTAARRLIYDGYRDLHYDLTDFEKDQILIFGHVLPIKTK